MTDDNLSGSMAAFSEPVEPGSFAAQVREQQAQARQRNLERRAQVPVDQDAYDDLLAKVKAAYVAGPAAILRVIADVVEDDTYGVVATWRDDDAGGALEEIADFLRDGRRK
jgi:hypothetical protein